jgi:hypothetical protein
LWQASSVVRGGIATRSQLRMVAKTMMLDR